jgi:hypothetical protein
MSRPGRSSAFSFLMKVAGHGAAPCMHACTGRPVLQASGTASPAPLYHSYGCANYGDGP